MRRHHERLSFTFDLYARGGDERDVSQIARGLVDQAQARLRGWIGNWLDPLEERPMTLGSVERRAGGIMRIGISSPPTVPGRMLTYLVGLVFHADRAFIHLEKRRYDLVILSGPLAYTLRDLRALPIRYRGAPWLVEWDESEGADADSLCLSRSADERLVAGQLDAGTRRRIDEARAADRGEDPLSARIHLEDQSAIVAALEAGELGALAEAALLARPTPATIRALIASARILDHDRVAPIVTAMVTLPGVLEQLAPAWHAGGEQEKLVATIAAKRTLGMMYRRADGRVTRQTELDLDPVLRSA